LIGKLLQLLVHHLDTHRFESGGKKREQKAFLESQAALVSENAWIIEGCGITTLELRLEKTNLLLYFPFSRWLCIYRILKRFFFRDVL